METAADKRQKHLVLDLSNHLNPVPRDELASVSSRMAAAHAQKGPRTLARDIASLEKARLIVRQANGCVANRNAILAFIPARANASDSLPPPDPNRPKPLWLFRTGSPNGPARRGRRRGGADRI